MGPPPLHVRSRFGKLGRFGDDSDAPGATAGRVREPSSRLWSVVHKRRRLHSMGNASVRSGAFESLHRDRQAFIRYRRLCGHGVLRCRSGSNSGLPYRFIEFWHSKRGQRTDRLFLRPRDRHAGFPDARADTARAKQDIERDGYYRKGRPIMNRIGRVWKRETGFTLVEVMAASWCSRS